MAAIKHAITYIFEHLEAVKIQSLWSYIIIELALSPPASQGHIIPTKFTSSSELCLTAACF